MSTTTPRPTVLDAQCTCGAGRLPEWKIGGHAFDCAYRKGQLAEQRHLIDPLDHDYEQMPCANPDACSCNADYPGWTPGRTA
ncbi:hypothetical protein [Streptomyces malaysiensis]